MNTQLGQDNIEENECPFEDKELLSAEGITIWSATQENLENQALNELNEFAKETSSKLEDGELEDDEEQVKKPQEILNIENYIKKQEELRKVQLLKKKPYLNDDIQPETKNRKRKKSPHYERKKRLKEDEKLCNTEKSSGYSSGSEYIPSEDSDSEPSSCSNQNIRIKHDLNPHGIVIDDGLKADFKHRLNEYYKKLEEETAAQASHSNSIEIVNDVKLGDKFKIPAKYWEKLYKYQQKGVKWLWSLHQKSTGGLLGDEMGLGKTVQIIAFLYALDYSRIHSPFGNFIGIGPTLIVCPATVINQWVRHFHEWAPEFRVAVLHQSGRFQGNKSTLIKEINKNNGILVTTYLGVLKYKGNLIEHHWHYVILDEGHKIRNSTAKITLAVKQIRTPHRILLTGSPMQNNLQELWSLFDFTNPGMLGELNVFMEHFNNPIIQGGFANATPMQEATALSVATALKDMISPFLLRRTKDEVQKHIELPSKSEQVLFCSLSDYQRRLYKDYLMSEHVNSILSKEKKQWTSTDNRVRANMLMAITRLRKICNHPDIFLYDEDELPDQENIENLEDKFGFYKKSGKMIVVSALLKIWKKQKHRVLLFSQGRVMIRIFEEFLIEHGYKFLKMDGTTSVSSRQKLIDTFNEDESFDVFLLTTKVGGLGINLTGADRVIIYDPDWNPATDTQARERAWRIGQNKPVTIYRLLSAGTIEEKMYQRQIWKQLLSNKILIDPKTHRAFKSSDLYDLFSLQEPSEHSNPETTNIFHESRVKIQEKVMERKSKKKKDDQVVFSEEKIEKMKMLAQKLAKSLTKEAPIKTPYQKELEKEREEKIREKQKLKKLSVQELLDLNREKAKKKEDLSVNKLDDSELPCTFSRALEVAETRSKLYNKIVNKKLKVEELEKKLNKEKVVLDESGKIDGEKVDGLVKTEKKKIKEEKNSNDDFILNKLFSSKGVSGALEHDSIVKGGIRENNLRISTAASEKADKALQALRKSRIDKWRW